VNIPKGYKLVPNNMTEKMFMAWEGARSSYNNRYRKMLAAAPTPPKPIYDETKERELFETWSANHYYLGGCEVAMEDGEYKDTDMQYSWESWLACAQSRAKAGEMGHE
jgi:hypothetical protein